MIEFAAAKGPRLMLDETSVMDIGGCIVDGVDIAPMRAIPDDGDPRIDHSLEGFLFTCGPDHIRHPRTDPGRGRTARVYPLHGSASGHPAKVLWTKFENGNAECRADIDIVTVEGLPQRIERLWRIDGATGEVSLDDRVVNTSDQTVPVFLMYHMNTGGKWFDDGVRGSKARCSKAAVSPGPSAKSLAASSASRRRRREDGFAEVRLGPIAAVGGKTLRVRFRTDTLPLSAGLAEPEGAGARARHRAGFASLGIARRASGGR